MPKVFCSAFDCEFNGDNGECHAEDVYLSDASIMTLYEKRQRHQRCMTFQKSRMATEFEQLLNKSISKDVWQKEQEAQDG